MAARMSNRSLYTALCALTLVAAGCADDEVSCDHLVGTYEGTIQGSHASLNGTINFVVTTAYVGTADLEGNWTGLNGYFGKVNRADLSCSDGSVSYDYGFNLLGPNSVVCAPPCAPNDNDGGCYCTGATLGEFKGSLTSSGGTGTWRADSGAAGYLGVEGTGTWTVSRK